MSRLVRSSLVAVLITLVAATVVYAVSINWGASNPIFDETGVGNTMLANGDLVQLIWDQSGDGIDPPDNTNNIGQPSGDDQLLATSAIGVGSFFPGRFSANINTNTVGTGNRVYVRAWNTDVPVIGAWYGNSQMFTINSSVSFTLDATVSGSFPTGIPLAVTLASFDADCVGQEILVSWETVHEIDALGFNVWRSEDEAEPTTQLNAQLIPVQHPGGSTGGIYEFIDSDILPGQGYYYWLEDVDLGGTTTMHGPANATCNTPTAVSLVQFRAYQPVTGPVTERLPVLLALTISGFALFALWRRL